jgi:hypothetical protein
VVVGRAKKQMAINQSTTMGEITFPGQCHSPACGGTNSLPTLQFKGLDQYLIFCLPFPSSPFGVFRAGKKPSSTSKFTGRTNKQQVKTEHRQRRLLPRVLGTESHLFLALLLNYHFLHNPHEIKTQSASRERCFLTDITAVYLR